MIYPLTGVILAGGMNRRFDGRKKALFKINGKRMIDRIGEIFQDLFEEIILVTNDPESYSDWPFRIVSDRFPDRCSLNGIHAGLYYAHWPYAFVTACDVPFLKREVIEVILEQMDSDDADIIVPQTSAGFEPLCALYSRRCIETIEQAIKNKRYKIQELFNRVVLKKIPEPVLREADPHLLSFININSPEDLTLLRACLQQDDRLAADFRMIDALVL